MTQNEIDTLLRLLDNPQRELSIKYDKDNRVLKVTVTEQDGTDRLQFQKDISIRAFRGAYSSEMETMLDKWADDFDRGIRLAKQKPPA